MAGRQWENGPSHVVFAGQGPVGGLVTVDGHPILSPSVEQALKERHPNYRIDWIESAWGMSGFAIKERWKSEDPRWREVQEGKRDPDKAFDIVHRFNNDASSDDMLAFIENRMGRVRDPKKEAEKLIAQAEKLMRESQEQRVDEVVAQGTQRILDESDHLRQVRAGVERAHPMVSGADFSEREPKRLI
jgi:hypothetical protein